MYPAPSPGEHREQLWIYREECGEKYVGNFKIKVKDEESEEYYNTLKMRIFFQFIAQLYYDSIFYFLFHLTNYLKLFD